MTYTVTHTLVRPDVNTPFWWVHSIAEGSAWHEALFNSLDVLEAKTVLSEDGLTRVTTVIFKTQQAAADLFSLMQAERAVIDAAWATYNDSHGITHTVEAQ